MRKKAKSQNKKTYVKRRTSCKNSYSCLAWSRNSTMRRYKRHIIKDPVFPGEKKKRSDHQD